MERMRKQKIGQRKNTVVGLMSVILCIMVVIFLQLALKIVMNNMAIFL